MKIRDLITQDKATLSFEVFPPKKDTDFADVEAAALGIAAFKPDYMSVTYGAGGSTKGHTIQLAQEIQEKYDVPTIAHLTCVCASKEGIKTALADMKNAGIENILALRGDIPKNYDGQVFAEFSHASELVELIKETGDFCVGGACYPEVHPDSANKHEDIIGLKKKVDAGCDYLTTQMFFDNNIFFKQTSDYKEADKRAFKESISEFKKEVESIGGKLVLIFIPSKEQISPELLKEVLDEYNISKEEIDLSIPNKLCQSVANALRVELYDLTTEFRQSNSFPFFTHDEHMNVVGHQLIAERIVKELSSISGGYDYLSEGNYHERYPTIHADGTMVYQSQTEHYYTINRLNMNNGYREELWRGVSELVHPMISNDGRYLVFTEGEQESLNTDVILYDFFKGHQVAINKKPAKGAIPCVNKSATKIAFPSWTMEHTTPSIVLYDIATGRQTQFEDGVECWRPVFSNDDRHIYYIQKETQDSHFVIKSYDVATGKKCVVLKHPYDIWDIAVSPSGKYIAYAGNKDTNWDLFIYDIEQKQSRQITHTLGDEWDPAFGISDDELWFAGVFGINDGIYHIKLKK